MNEIKYTKKAIILENNLKALIGVIYLFLSEVGEAINM
jgi:hypothetical protein